MFSWCLDGSGASLEGRPQRPEVPFSSHVARVPTAHLTYHRSCWASPPGCGWRLSDFSTIKLLLFLSFSYCALRKGSHWAQPSPSSFGVTSLFHYMLLTTPYVPGAVLGTRAGEGWKTGPLPSGNSGSRRQNQKVGSQSQSPAVSVARSFHRSTKVPSHQAFLFYVSVL